MEDDFIMKENENALASTCNFRDVNPIMMALPYPLTQVREKNQAYANLISIDYCGAVSCDRCPLAKTILGIAMAEMIHLQKLGELIFLLGGNINFIARHRDGRQIMWTPQYLNLRENAKEMLAANIEGERAAIEQYQMHIKMINDDCVNAVLARIIQDEEYHIMVLRAMMKEL